MVIVHPKIIRCLLIIALTISVAPLVYGPVGAQATQTSPGFTVFGDSPVVHHGPQGSWNETYTDPGAVFYYNGLFHMFYNGFNGWPATVQIGYATSPDGYTWTKQGQDPVLKTDQVQYAKIAALASSALVTADGTWVLYFYTWEDMNNFTRAKGRIGRATAANPQGPWTVDPMPALEPGGAGTWDDLRVDAPSVVYTDNNYAMYYAGTNEAGDTMIGLATSSDGIRWTKYKDATLTDKAFAESAPVLRLATDVNTWDGTRVQQPRVEHTPDGWVMVYRSVVAGSPATIALGYALSSDGVHWTRSTHNPMVEAPKVFAKRGFWYTAFAYHDNTYFLYIEAQPGILYETEVFLTTHQGSLTD